MALVVKDRVKETTTSTGTGTITLAGATQGYQSFSVVGDGNTTYYTITNGTDWEVGIGTYTASGTTLSRDTILESSSAGAAVNFSAGIKDVFVTYPAEKAVTLDGTETLTNKTINGSNNTITNVSLTTGITGTLAVANGGTGATSLTSGYLVKGNGTSAASASIIYDSGSNVGVGTSSPTEKLDTRGSIAVINPTDTANNTQQSGVTFGTGTTYKAGIQGYRYNGSYEVGLDFFVSLTGSGAYTRAMRIDSSGNVGVGTSSPSQLLHVQSASGAAGSAVARLAASGSVGLEVGQEFFSTPTDSTGALRSGRIYSKFDGISYTNARLSFQSVTTGNTLVDTMHLKNGNVGIGTSSPSQLLEVRNLSGDARVGIRSIDTGIAALMLGDDTNGSASYVSYNNAVNALSFGTTSNERMRIDSAGRVGIGTTSPDGNGNLTVAATSGAAGLTIQRTNTGVGGAQGFVGFKSVNGKFTSAITNLTSGDDDTAALVFRTATTSTVTSPYTVTERMRIDSSGNVGVGTSSPQKKFVVSNAGANGIEFEPDSASASGNRLFSFNRGTSAYTLLALDGLDLRFRTGASATERMRIDSSGNVGIGTSSPASVYLGSGGVDASGYLISRGAIESHQTNAAVVQYLSNAMQLRAYGATAGTGYMTFSTGGGGGSADTERMRIDSSGNVIIGTTATNNKFFVTYSNPSSVPAAGAGGHCTAFGAAGYGLTTGALTSGKAYLQATRWDGTATNYDLLLQPNGGNVGVGTSSPAYKLDVNGAVQATDYRVTAAGVFYLTGDSWQFRTTGGTERMRIDSSGNVGVGTASPNARISAQINSGNYLLDLINGSEIGFALRTYNHGSASAPGLVFTQGLYYGTTENAAIKFYRGGGSTGGYLGFTVTDGTERLSINSSGNVTANVDFRAPIFYDSGNTAYYLDPNTSGASIVVNGYMLGGFGALSTSGTLDWNDTSNVRSGSTGTLLLGTATNGMGDSIYYHPFNFEYSSKNGSGNVTQMAIAYGSPGNKLWMRGRYSGSWTSWVEFLNTGADSQTKSGVLQSNSSLRAPIFYDSDNTAYYVNPAGTSVLSGADFDGIVRIATGSIGTANTTNGLIFDGNYTNGQYRHRFRKRDDSGGIPLYLDYAAGTANSYTELMKFGPNTADGSYLTVYGQGYATGNFRAPIFYDSNNTGNYLDPNGSSVLNVVYAQQYLWGSDGNYGTVGATIYCDTVNSGYDADPLELCYVKGSEVRIGAGGGTKPIVAGTYARPSAHTGYLDGRYGSASSNSTVNPIYCISTSYAPTSSTALGSMYGIGYTDGGTSGVWSGGGWGMYVVDNGNVRHFLDAANGIGYATGSYRTPIFYDSSDTSYYVDPNSTSVTNRMGAYYFQHNGPVSDNRTFGLYFSNDLSSAYAIYRESGAWSSPYPDLRIAFHTGIKIGANAGYNGVRFYDDYTMATQVMSVNNGSDGVGAGNVFVNNVLQAGGDLRAPIFYDSNDTGFFIDPNGGSKFVVQGGTDGGNSRGIFMWTGADTNWGIYMGQSGAGRSLSGGTAAASLLGATAHHIRFRVATNDSQGFLWENNSEGALMSLNGSSGDLVVRNSVRAPIFYDSNNTGYYVDPNSTSNLWTLNVFNTGTSINASGSIVAAGNVTAYSDIRVKDNVEQIGGALERLQAIRGVTYTRNDLEDKERRYAGVIAQEIEEVLPEAVFDNGDRKAVDYNATIGLLIEAIKELKAEVETLKKG